MANGYTWLVREGKVTTLREFALRCSGMIGYNYVLAREGVEQPALVKQVVNDYYIQAVVEARADVAKYDAMTLAEAATELRQTCGTFAKQTTEYVEDQEKAISRFVGMRAKVEAWNPPTPDHEEFKAALLRELDQAISYAHRCYKNQVTAIPQPVTDVEKWLDIRRKCCRERLAEVEAELAAQEKRVDEANEWNRALVASLEGL